MKYFFIYSAGGGAGDWNGLKRIWSDKMPIVLKKRILLKFGDIFYNHASSNNLVKPVLWKNVNNIREWLYSGVNDKYVRKDSIIFLDSGTSKIVNYVKTKYPNYNTLQIIKKFNDLVDSEKILEKYRDVVLASNINEAITFDIPNPFKIRTQSKNTSTSIFSGAETQILLKITADYANKQYALFNNDQEKLITVINGLWNAKQINQFLALLNYTPDKIAIAGLTRQRSDIIPIIKDLNNILNFKNYNRVHFLGLGGISNANAIKSVINTERISVDNSTPMNRAIDGSINGITNSGYFNYTDKKLIRINPTTKKLILKKHVAASNPLLSLTDLEKMLDAILLHQSNNSSQATYEARALLAIHNHDVFRNNAI